MYLWALSIQIQRTEASYSFFSILHLLCISGINGQNSRIGGYRARRWVCLAGPPRRSLLVRDTEVQVPPNTDESIPNPNILSDLSGRGAPTIHPIHLSIRCAAWIDQKTSDSSPPPPR